MGKRRKGLGESEVKKESECWRRAKGDAIRSGPPLYKRQVQRLSPIWGIIRSAAPQYKSPQVLWINSPALKQVLGSFTSDISINPVIANVWRIGESRTWVHAKYRCMPRPATTRPFSIVFARPNSIWTFLSKNLRLFLVASLAPSALHGPHLGVRERGIRQRSDEFAGVRVLQAQEYCDLKP